MNKILMGAILASSLSYANMKTCQWALNEVDILTAELAGHIANGTKKQKQDTFNNMADVVQYELITDCKGHVPNATIMEVVNGLHSIKQRAIREGWWK